MIDNIKIQVKGLDFSSEALVIVALLRKLGVTTIDTAGLDFTEPKGLVLDKHKIYFEEN